MKFIIIGAGPIGCYAAYLLAKANQEVEVYEEHEDIGLPFQCTGLLTGSFEELIKIPDDVIENEIGKINVFPPDNNKLHLNLKKKEVILDRTKFDQFLAKKAKKAGAKIYTSHKYTNYNNNQVTIKDIKNNKVKTIKTEFLIGADGPNSSIRKLINKKTKIKFYVGAQATINIKKDENEFDTFFGEKFPYFFGWIVPTSKDKARIGLAAKNKSGLLFEKFMEEKIGKNYKNSLCEHQGGLIPVYNPKLTIKKDNIAIIGDAATQLKATTGGGIVPGMTAAKEIIEKILKNKNNIKNKNLKIHKQLLIHLMARNVLDTFSDKDYNILIKLCKQKKIKELLENHSRDYPTKFVFKMLIKEPRFLRYLCNVIIKT